MAVSKAAISSFYDVHSARMLQDYVQGNLRVSAAIDLVIATLTGRKGRLLDIGCGIGISSSAFIRALPEFEVLGVDISPRSIDIATRLFGTNRAAFAVSDLSTAPAEAPFDAIAMIDVYEHFPRSDWPRLNATLSACLAPEGVLILTTPSPLHQQHLQQHNPAALQIVDETVELADIANLATALQGTLTHYRLEHCWRSNQYLHVVIEKAPKFEKPYLLRPQKRSLHSRAVDRAKLVMTTSKHKVAAYQRRSRVKKRLGLSLDGSRT